MDTQAAWLALSPPQINFSVSNNCMKALSSLAGQLHLSIIWVPGHSKIFGNKKAVNSLVRKIRGGVNTMPAGNDQKRVLYQFLTNIHQMV